MYVQIFIYKIYSEEKNLILNKHTSTNLLSVFIAFVFKSKIELSCSSILIYFFTSIKNPNKMNIPVFLQVGHSFEI